MTITTPHSRFVGGHTCMAVAIGSSATTTQCHTMSQGTFGFADSTGDMYGGNGHDSHHHHHDDEHIADEQGLITAHSPRRTALPLVVHDEDEEEHPMHLAELYAAPHKHIVLQPTTGSNTHSLVDGSSTTTTASNIPQRASSASSGAGDQQHSMQYPLFWKTSAFDYEEGMSPALSRARAIARYREKKLRRCYAKRVRYAARKANALARPRINGRFVKRQVAVACA